MKAPAGAFINQGSDPQPVEKPEVLQGYLESSNVTPLREMVDLVNIARAYEANQKLIQTRDQALGRTIETLG
jgi:flagellar basal body rod protein FlgG